MIRFTITNVYFGANLYSSEPVIVGNLEISDDLAARADEIIAKIRALTVWWFECDFEDRALSRAEILADFILRWSFAALTYPPNFLHDFGCRKIAPDTFRIWIAFHDPKISLSALQIAANLAMATARGKVDEEQLQVEIDRFWRVCWEKHPDAQAQIAMEAARVHEIPIIPAWNMTHHWQFGWGAKSEVLFLGASNRDGFVSSRIIGNKQSSKALIRRLGLPTPKDVMINDEEEIAAAIDTVGFPCVVKPVDQGGGSGVSVNLNNAEEVRVAFHHARKLSGRPIMLEALVHGTDHRLMIMDGRFIGAFRREPPAVIGDGSHTIKELIDQENRTRMLPGVESISRLASIALDNGAIEHLLRQGITPEVVLAPGQKATLRGNSNLVTGGSCTDVTADMHPDIRIAVEALTRTLDVDLGGFDYVTADISRSWQEVPGAFIELNLTPALDVPTLAGWQPAEVGKLVLGGLPGRIPLELIIVPEGQVKAVETHLTEVIVDQASGWASFDHAQLGRLPLCVQGSHPWSGVISLLSHKLVEKAIIVVANKHVQSFGLPIDRADRIWICDTDLPAEWLEVARRVSRAAPWIGSWEECQKTVQPNKHH